MKLFLSLIRHTWSYAGDKYRNLSEEEKTKRENMEKTDIIIYLKKRNKN